MRVEVLAAGPDAFSSVLLAGHGVAGVFSGFSSMAGPAIIESIVSPKTLCLHPCPGALIDLSCNGGRPGIVANDLLTQPPFDRNFLPDLRESIATSCTVVIVPSSGTLAFRRRVSGSFDFDLLFCPPATCCSGSGVFLPCNDIDNLSFDGNS